MILFLRDVGVKALCLVTGHIRGKRVNELDGVATFRCPRCKTTWTRKLRKKSSAADARDGD